MTAIAQREAELREILNELTEPGKNSIPDQISRLREVAKERLSKLRELVFHPGSVDQFRAVLGEHFGTFTLRSWKSREGNHTEPGEVLICSGEAVWRERVVPEAGSGPKVCLSGLGGGQQPHELPPLPKAERLTRAIMCPKTLTPAMRLLPRNEIASEISYAYVQAVAAAAGMTCQCASRGLDSAGLDVIISAREQFAPDSILTDISIHLQLKATSQEHRINNDRFSFFFGS